MMISLRNATLLLLALSTGALAGPPYVTDDPEPTDLGQYEIYAFADGTFVRGGTAGETGLDMNYGAGSNLQLTLVVPAAYEDASGEWTTGLGNIEAAAKFRILHQDGFGLDVAVFPRLFLPSPDSVGGRHASLLLPVWAQKDWGAWSAFGGGGCELNRGGTSRDFCLAGFAVTRQISPDLQLGAEIQHRTADTIGGRATTGVDAGFRYDASATYHFLGSFGPGIQNAAQTDRFSWYAALLVTF
jgi:hypothetical protein